MNPDPTENFRVKQQWKEKNIKSIQKAFQRLLNDASYLDEFIHFLKGFCGDFFPAKR
jgi:hypothetical protein